MSMIEYDDTFASADSHESPRFGEDDHVLMLQWIVVCMRNVEDASLPPATRLKLHQAVYCISSYWLEVHSVNVLGEREELLRVEGIRAFLDVLRSLGSPPSAHPKKLSLIIWLHTLNEVGENSHTVRAHLPALYSEIREHPENTVAAVKDFISRYNVERAKHDVRRYGEIAKRFDSIADERRIRAAHLDTDMGVNATGGLSRVQSLASVFAPPLAAEAAAAVASDDESDDDEVVDAQRVRDRLHAKYRETYEENDAVADAIATAVLHNIQSHPTFKGRRMDDELVFDFVRYTIDAKRGDETYVQLVRNNFDLRELGDVIGSA